MPRIKTASVGEFYQHYPKVATILTVNAGGKKNAMAAVAHSFISYKPPLYGVAVAPKRYTYKLIVEAGKFGINFMPFEAAELVASVGGSGGKEIDKFIKFDIAEEKPLKTGAPILQDAYAAYECKLVDNKTYGDHVWIVGEIVAVHCIDDVFTSKGTLDLERVNPTLYLGAELYITADRKSVQLLDRDAYGRR